MTEEEPANNVVLFATHRWRHLGYLDPFVRNGIFKNLEAMRQLTSAVSTLDKEIQEELSSGRICSERGAALADANDRIARDLAKMIETYLAKLEGI